MLKVTASGFIISRSLFGQEPTELGVAGGTCNSYVSQHMGTTWQQMMPEELHVSQTLPAPKSSESQTTSSLPGFPQVKPLGQI